MKTYRKHPRPLMEGFKRPQDNKGIEDYSTQPPTEAQDRSVFLSIEENFGFLDSVLGPGIGLVKARYEVLDGRILVGLVYVESMADVKMLSSHLVEPLQKGLLDCDAGLGNSLAQIKAQLISVPDTTITSDMKQAMGSLFNGGSLLFVDGIDSTLVIESSKAEVRGIEKPDNEVTVSAAMDSFTEDLDVNCSLIIRRLPTPALHFESFTVGQLSKTTVKLIWLKGIANEKVVEEARRRIKQVDIDNVEGTGVLAELIRDHPLSIYPTYRQTQRPDMTSRHLTDGAFAILCSNSPFAFTAPVSFWDNFKTMDDYAEATVVGSYLRLSRILSFILSILVSPLYLAFVTFNHTIVPPALALNIATGRQGVPFPSVVELLVLTLSITVIREASMRISGSVGFFIGTLSAIVIGQASVTAGYVSASVIIVSAVTAITSFAVSAPALAYTSRLTNYFLILLASVFGMFGVINGLVLVILHITSLKSFGVPYLYPLVPFSPAGLKDALIRAPQNTLRQRLRILAPFNQVRVKNKEE